MEVKTFTEEGVLKICQDCGSTVLVNKEVDSCPVCGSRRMEIEQCFGESGECSREILYNDFYYEPDILPVGERKLSFGSKKKSSITREIPMDGLEELMRDIFYPENEEPDDSFVDEDDKNLPPIISMFPIR